MKKFILMLVAVLTMISANAQLVTSTTYVKKTNPKTWYIRTGLSLNNGAGSMASDLNYDNSENGEIEKSSPGAKAGFEVMVGFQQPINKSPLYWGMEFGLGTRGASIKTEKQWIDYGDVNYENLNAGLLTYNVKFLPFIIGYKFDVVENIKIDPHVGAFISYDFAGSTSGKWKNCYYGYKKDVDIDCTFSDLKDDIDWLGLDAGIQVGVGVWYKRFNFDISYQRGFIPAAKVDYGYSNDDVKAFSSNLMLRVGVSF